MPMLYNRITENGGGILFGGGSETTIAHNEINNNTFFGIYAKKGGLANVRYNNINNNGKGVIFFKVKDINLRDNNITGNTDYSISMLDGQSENIVAQNNWWGTTDQAKIKDSIRDHARDKELGQVDFSNSLPAAVSGAGLLW
jgi:parallel beta-helix repeat protein